MPQEIPPDSYVEIDNLPDGEREEFSAYMDTSTHDRPRVEGKGPLAGIAEYRLWKMVYLQSHNPGLTLEQAKKQVFPGWGSLVEEAYSLMPPGTLVSDVKEKWGGLRIYADVPAEIDNKLNEIEARSFEICDVCGNPGTIREDHWCRTRCDEHEGWTWREIESLGTGD